jgi:glycosyltransferase involved in cell wall biosynthesis
LRPEQFRYVPFKINSYETILRTECSDEGYIFCGGLSRRDFNALFQAVSGLDCRVVVLTAPNPVLTQHGSFLDDSKVPENVTVIRTDGGAGPFIQTMAAARFVVLPIKRGVSMPTGISVYIEAMALRKCVVISGCPGVDDVLTEQQAIIVPPGDVSALRRAILRVLADQDYRMQYAERGYCYAMTLQGDQRLRQSIIRELSWDFHAGAE